MKKNQPHHFAYKYSEGPLPLEKLSQAKFISDNCRRAVQDYLYFVHNLYVPPEQVLLPEGYFHTGVFITKDGVISHSLYKPGDIVYAEKIRDKNNNLVNKRREYFKTENEWIIQLHSAILINRDTIYHATAISGETCSWNFKKFNKYYKIVAVKRIMGIYMN